MNRLETKMLVLNAVPAVYLLVILFSKGRTFDFSALLLRHPLFDKILVVCVLGCLIIAPSMLLSSYYHTVKEGEEGSRHAFFASSLIFCVIAVLLMCFLHVVLPQLLVLPLFALIVYIPGGYLLKKLAIRRRED